MFVDQNKKATPITRFLDVGAFLQDMDELARKAAKAPHQAVHQDQRLDASSSGTSTRTGRPRA